MDSALMIQVLGTMLGSTVLVSLLTAYLNRRKLGAEATDLITKAATGVVGNVTADNDRLRAEAVKRDERIAELEGRLDRMELRERQHYADMMSIRETLQEHAEYDSRMLSRLEELDPQARVVFRQVPPLLPPHLRVVHGQ